MIIISSMFNFTYFVSSEARKGEQKFSDSFFVLESPYNSKMKRVYSNNKLHVQVQLAIIVVVAKTTHFAWPFSSMNFDARTPST